MTGLIAFTGVAVALLLAAEWRDERRSDRRGVWLFKPLASTGFVAIALSAGALDSIYGRWVLAALALSWLGDVLLIPRSKSIFLAGIGSFLLGHVAFVVVPLRMRTTSAMSAGMAATPITIMPEIM